MFTRIQSHRYRSLRSIDRRLRPFQALVGPNASGKTTFLDTISLLGDLMRKRGEVREALSSRSESFSTLLWKGEGGAFQLAVEARIPDLVRAKVMPSRQAAEMVRYEIEVGFDDALNEVGLDHETLWLMEPDPVAKGQQREFFPSLQTGGPILSERKKITGRRTAINKVRGGNDTFYPDGRDSYQPSYKLGRTKAALANLPADEVNFPVGTWFRNLLENGVQTLTLNSQLIRKPSPPGQGRAFRPDGSNLPWVVDSLRKLPERFELWLEHIRTALPDVLDVDTVEREDDRHRYLVVRYSTGAKVPSWLVSDGTLRLLALTILAYIDLGEGVFLIEEPENGIHPRAIETVMQSLSSVYGSQVLLATHSPVALNLLQRDQILCFAKDEQGATDIVSGEEHPVLGQWKAGQPDMGLLFASGILS